MISRLSRLSCVCIAILLTVLVLASCSTTKPVASGLSQSSDQMSTLKRPLSSVTEDFSSSKDVLHLVLACTLEGTSP